MIGARRVFPADIFRYVGIKRRIAHHMKSTWSLFNADNPLLDKSKNHSTSLNSTPLLSWIKHKIIQASITGDSMNRNDTETQSTIDFDSIQPSHILEAAQAVQADNHDRMNKLVSFIRTMNVDEPTTISNITLLKFYDTIVNEGILSVHISTTNMRNIIALFAITQQNHYSFMNYYLNEASQVLTSWIDYPHQSLVIYQALFWLKNHFETALLQLDALDSNLQLQGSSQRFLLRKRLTIIKNFLLTGPNQNMDNNNNHRYTMENLTHIHDFRQQLKNLQSQFLRQTSQTRPFPTYERNKILNLMCSILSVQQSIAKSMGYTSMADMNLSQYSPMVKSIGGISTINKLHHEILTILNQNHLDLHIDAMNTKCFCYLDTVLQVLFELCEDLFHIKCHIVKNLCSEMCHSWVDDDTNLILIHIYDKQLIDNNQHLLGSIILDPMERRGKVHGEFLIPIINKKFLSQIHEVSETLPLIPFISLNISNQLKDGPSIRMTMDDTKALFHEVGHALETILRMRTVEDVFLFQTEQDVSEMVSQFMEYWLYDVRILSKIVTIVGGTNEKEKIKIIDRIQDERRSQKWMVLFHRILLSELELRLHDFGNNAIESSTLENIVLSTKRIFAPATVFDDVDDDIEFLIHIFENNAKGKNTLEHRYLWSEIISADSYNAFHSTHISQHELGDLGCSFRRHLLERRKALDDKVYNELFEMNIAFRLFRGRDASSKEFMNMISPQKDKRKPFGQKRTTGRGYSSPSSNGKSRNRAYFE